MKNFKQVSKVLLNNEFTLYKGTNMSNDDLSFLFGIKSTTITEVTRDVDNYEYIFGDENSIEGDDPIVDKAVKEFDSLLPILNSAYKNDPNIQMYQEALAKLCGCYVQFSMSFENIINNIGKTLQNEKLKQIYDMLLPKMKGKSEYAYKCRNAFANLFNLDDAGLKLITNRIDDICSSIKNHDFIDFVKIDSLINKNRYSYKPDNKELFNLFVKDYVNHLKETHEQSLNSKINELPNVANKDDILIQYVKKHLNISNEYELIGNLNKYLNGIINKTHPKDIYVRALSKDPGLSYFKRILEYINNEDVSRVLENKLDLFKYLDNYDYSKILPALFLTLTPKEQETLNDLGIDTARKILLRVKDKEIRRGHLKFLLNQEFDVLKKLNWDNNNLKEWEYILKRPEYQDVIKQRNTQRKAESFQESDDDNKSEEEEIKNKIKASKDSLRHFYKNQKDLERQETDERIKAKTASENEIKNKELHDFDYKIERIIELDNNNGYKYRNAIHYLLDNVESATEEDRREVAKFILDRLEEFTPEEILSVTKAYNKTLKSTINILQVFYPIGKFLNREFDPKFPLEPLFSNYELKQFSLGREIFKDFFYLTETQLNCFRKCIADANGNKEDEDLFVEQYFALLNETGINIEQNDKLINVTNYELAMAFVNSSSEAKTNFINELHSAENSSNKNYKFAAIIQKYLMPNIKFKDPTKTKNTINTIRNAKSNDNTNVSKELDINDDKDQVANKELDYSKLFTFLKEEGLLNQFISLIKDSGINTEVTENSYDDNIDLFSKDLQLLIKHKNLNNRYISYFLSMNDENSLFAIAVLLFSKNSKMEIDTQKINTFYKEYINLKNNNQDNKSNQNIFDEVTDSINKDIDNTLFKLLKTSNTYTKTFDILSKGNVQIDENLILGSRRFKNICYNLFKRSNVKIDDKLFDVIKNADSFKKFLEDKNTKEKLKKYFKVDDVEIFNKLMSMDKSMLNSKEYIEFFNCIDLNMFNNAIDNILNSYPDNISNKIIDKINFANVNNDNYIKVIACLLSDNQYDVMHIVNDEPDSMSITVNILSDQIDYTKNKEDSEEEEDNIIVNSKNTLNNILDTIIDKLDKLYNHNELQKFYNRQDELSDEYKQIDNVSNASLINIISDINSAIDSKIEDINKVDIFDLNNKRTRKALSYTYNVINDKEQTDKNFLNDDRFLKDFISKHPNVYDIDALNAIYNLKKNNKQLIMIPKEYLKNLNTSIKDIINENDLIKNMTVEDYLKDNTIEFNLNYDILKNIDITSIVNDNYKYLNEKFKKNIDEINKDFINQKNNINKEIKEIILQINSLDKGDDKDKQNKIEELKNKRHELINKKKEMQQQMQSTIIKNIDFDSIVEINDILNDKIIELEGSREIANNKDLLDHFKKLKLTIKVLTNEINDYNEKNKQLTAKLTSEFNDKKDHNNKDGNSLETFSTIIQRQNFPAKFKEYEKTINEVSNDNINKIIEILNINEKETSDLKLHIMKAREENDKESIRQYINELNEKLKNKFITIKDNIITNSEKDCLDSFNKLSDIINETLQRFSDSTNSKKFPNSQYLKNFIEKEKSLFLKLRTQFNNALLEQTSIFDNLCKQNLTDLMNSSQQDLSSVVDSLNNCKLQLENLKTSLEKQPKNN